MTDSLRTAAQALLDMWDREFPTPTFVESPRAAALRAALAEQDALEEARTAVIEAAIQVDAMMRMPFAGDIWEQGLRDYLVGPFRKALDRLEAATLQEEGGGDHP